MGACSYLSVTHLLWTNAMVAIVTTPHSQTENRRPGHAQQQQRQWQWQECIGVCARMNVSVCVCVNVGFCSGTPQTRRRQEKTDVDGTFQRRHIASFRSSPLVVFCFIFIRLRWSNGSWYRQGRGASGKCFTWHHWASVHIITITHFWRQNEPSIF